MSLNREATLRRLAATVTSELSLEAALRGLVAAARELVDARYAALGVARPDRRGLDRFLFVGMTDEDAKRIGHLPRGLGLLGALLHEPRPHRTRRIADDPRSIGFPPGHPPMTSFLGVPILWRGEVLGNFYLTDKIGADEFSREDEELLVGLASFAAVSIVNARLHTETAEALRLKVFEAERAHERLRLLVELSAMLPTGPIASDLPIEGVLRRVSEVLGDVCALYLLDPTGAPERKIVTHQDNARSRAGAEIIEAAWASIREQVLVRDQSVFIIDADAVSSPALGVIANGLRAGRFASAIVVPVRTVRETIGVFASLSTTPLRLDAEDLALGTLIASRLGTAIENARLVA
ncbi:MAG: GAF domain-containing protein [Deltaproteobacteria bacterium]|nr:GAF domain-containing protein [Deltaproteobacteria bacterium]